ncbi:MAG TPA: hypothetical protein VGG09_14215 [Acidimicrobiales bacterium]
MSAPRYRCDACGNLTRFDVTVSQTTKSFHHYTVGGDLVVEDEEIVSRSVDAVVCRWCGHGRSVVEITDEEHSEHSEPDAPSKAS